MADQKKEQKKPNFVMPSLDTSKLASMSGVPQLTSREEQAQYRMQGIQDGKVDELIKHE